MDWKAYKQAAALPFESLDCQVQVEKTVEGNRGDHRIDVWIEAQQYGVQTRWLIDCRHWNTPVTKADVFALRQVMKDVKGDRALMLSNAGFDSGATKAARSTSITLTTLETIQENAELEFTRTTLISLENRITKLKQSLERLSESVQVAPGLWQSRPKPGVDAKWVAKTNEALEAIKFGFAKARLQQPPYFVQKDEATGQPQLAQTIEAFVTRAAALIDTAEDKLKQQHKQITQARRSAPAVEPNNSDNSEASANSEEAQVTGSQSKSKRSLHAAFFRRKVSTPPVRLVQTGDRPRQKGDERSRKGHNPNKPVLKGTTSEGAVSRGRRQDSRRNFRPGPQEMGPLRTRSKGPRFGEQQGTSAASGSSGATHEKPKLAQKQIGKLAGQLEHNTSPRPASHAAPPRLKSRTEQQNQVDLTSAQEPSAETIQAPSLEGRWWDQPDSRDLPQRRSHRHPRTNARSSAAGSRGHHAPRPRLTSKRPRLAGEQLGDRKFSGRQAGTGQVGERKFGRQKFGKQKFAKQKFAGKKHSGNHSSRASLQANGFHSGKFTSRRKPMIGSRSAVAKPLLRKQSTAQSASADRE